MEEATGEMSTTYVVRKSGRLTMEFGVVITRQNFGFHCSFFVLSLSVCQGKGEEVDTSAVALSEAKTQRRPDSARERVRGVGFLCCFVVFASFFQQGKKRHRGGDYGEEAVKRVKRGGGLRGLRRDCGRLWATPRATLVADAPRCIRRRGSRRTTGLARVHRLMRCSS